MLQLDNLSGDTSEQITKLFPKCRPRDNNNHLNTTISRGDDNNHNDILVMMDTESDRCLALNREVCEDGEPDEDEGNGDDNDDDETSSDDMNDDDDLTVDHSQDDSSNDVIVVSSGHKGQSYKLREPTESTNDMIVVGGGKSGSYKLRDSRIIEIAGGREMFSHSRTKGSRKSRYNDEPETVGAKRNKIQGVWELRSRNGEPKKQRNARDVTETVFSSEVHSVRHQRNATSPCAVPVEAVPRDSASPLAVTKGEVVVFDDIDDDWRGLRLDLAGVAITSNGDRKEEERDSSSDSHASPPAHHRNASDFFKAVTSGDLDGNSLSPEHVRGSKVGRVIGGLPIAEYEGSPRRYGPRQPDLTLPSAHSLLASPSVYPPRPGFVQRVLPPEADLVEPDPPSPSLAGGTFDYLYEFSETRKVLEEFFKCPAVSSTDETSAEFQELEYELRRQAGSSYVGQRLAKGAADKGDGEKGDGMFLDLSAGEEGSTEDTEIGLQVGHSRNFTLSPETTDCDSNCGDLDSEASLLMEGEGGGSGVGEAAQDSQRLYSSMPVLEDGLSSGHASDTDNNNPTVLLMKRQITEIEREIGQRSGREKQADALAVEEMFSAIKNLNSSGYDLELEALDPLGAGMTPPPPAPQPHRSISLDAQSLGLSDSVEAAIKDIRMALQRTKPLKSPTNESPEQRDSPVWVPRRRGEKEDGDEEEADTDLETDRLLGQQRTDDHGFFDDKLGWRKPKSRTVMPIVTKTSPPLATTKLPTNLAKPPTAPSNSSHASPASSPLVAAAGTSDATDDASATDKALSPAKDAAVKSKKDKDGSTKKKGRNKEVMIHEPAVLIEGVLFRAHYLGSTQLVCEGQPTKSTRMMQAEEAVSRIKDGMEQSHHLAGCQGLPADPAPDDMAPPSVFRLSFLGSVEVDEEGGRKRRKRLKKHMVEEAVAKIKAPEGETQPSTEVDLFISTEKIMVLNTDLKEIMMDHALRTISYIADIGDLVVLMARRRFVPHDVEEPPKINRTPKMICHVFESEEAQFIAQSIGQAFQVAYMEFLKANGIEDHSFVKEMDYQEVLNSQEIFGDELQMFAKKEMQKEVVVPKAKNEILGVVIVESGWGSMLPTVVIANLAPSGAAARCGQLNIGDQIIAINGVSLVGLPLSTCQNYIKNTKNQTVVKLTVVPCAPVVEVKIKRPDTKYQLGFSVQNGVICSLLRGGIAERGGVRVGHRIIEINNQSVVAVPHEKIVNLLATSVGEILMKTMPTSMFRLLTGQETPVYI